MYIKSLLMHKLE